MSHTAFEYPRPLRMSRPFAAATLLVVGSMVAWAPPASAQVPAPDLRTQSYMGLGYTVNIPNVYSGISAFRMFGGSGWGVYVDAKYTFDSPGDDEFFYPDETTGNAAARNDQRIRDEDVFRTVAGGVVRALHPEIAVYLGAGYTQQESFKEFQNIGEEGPELGDRGGYYWLEDTAESRSGINMQGGVFLQAGRSLFFQLGGELFPLGAQLGVFIALPR